MTRVPGVVLAVVKVAEDTGPLLLCAGMAFHDVDELISPAEQALTVWLVEADAPACAEVPLSLAAKTAASFSWDGMLSR
jgi:ABC-type phosphate transport system permease subunit